MADIPTFDGEKNKSIAREMLGTVDRSSIQTKIVKSKTADGLDKETRLRTRAGENEFVTTVSAPEDPAIGPVGGFILSPSDGDEDPISPQPSHVWDKAFFKTVDYDPSTAQERLPLLKLLHKSQKNTRNKVRLHTKRKSKHVTWTGSKTYPSGKKKECIVSWDHGIKARYRMHYDQDCSGRIIKFTDEVPEIAQSGNPNVYVNGVEVQTKYTLPGTANEVELNVVGAAVFKKHLVFISHRDLDFPLVEDAPTRDGKIAAALAHSQTITLFYRAAGKWRVLGVHRASSALKAPWFFKPDGSRASAVRETTYANQWMMHIDISEDDAGNLTSSFSEERIEDSEPFYVETTISPVSSDTSGDLGWQTPGEWVTEESGATTDGFAVAPRPGTTPAGTLGLALELIAHGLTLGNTWSYEDYRASSSQAGYAAAGADNSIGKFDAWELYSIISEWGAVRGSTSFRAFRDTANVVEDGNHTDTYGRFTSGRRTIAVDYGFDGEFLKVTEELKSTGASFVEEIHEKISAEYRRPAYDVENIHSVIEQRTSYTASGKIEWLVKINDESFISFSGGIDNGGACSSSFSRKVDTTDTTSSDTITSYSHPSSGMHSERGWLIDFDARSRSAIYERLRYEFKPTPLPTSPQDSFMTAFPIRITTINTCVASLHLINNNTEVFAESFNVQPGSLVLRPYSLMLQLCPRFHDAKEKIEEDSFMQVLSYNYGTTLVDAYRVFYIEPGTLFDGMPRGGPVGDTEGQLQSRNIDQTVFSTASRTTAQITSPPMSAVPFTQLHNITYTTRAYIRDAEYPLLQTVSAKLAADSGASDFASPKDSLRLNPVFST